MSDEILLMPGEAGRYFDPPLGADRVRQLIDRGELRAVKTEGGWRLVPKAEVLRFVEERRRRAAADARE
jgi:excisionase family DNA binding protein